MQEWNATVQRQLPGTQQLTIAYVGTKGTHLVPITSGQDNGVNWNLATPGTGPVSPRERWPNDSTVDIYQSNNDSIYHALQVTLVKHWANSFTYQLAYTYSHLIDDEDPADLPIDYQALARGNGDYDIRHQFRGMFSYQLPFGRGKALLANSGRAVDEVLGGWQVNGGVSFYTGFPFSVIAAANTLNNGSGSFPELTGNPNLPTSARSVHEWFNINAFSNPGSEQYGNAGRNILFGPGTRELDASLEKNFAVTEHKRFEFRAEAFNLPNHPLLDVPNNTLGSPNSGTITTAGSDTTLQRTEREFQLALKFIF